MFQSYLTVCVKEFNMKRILINATHAEEVRVALCNGNHLYDFDLENRTREQKKANIYKGHVTRVEPSLEAVFVEYGSSRQGFLPIREIASEYLSGDPRSGNIKQLIKEGDELIVQVEKEERGNKGAALSTFVSLAGRYLVLMPNNPRGGGISRQISGKLREEMKQALASLVLPRGMSVILRTAGIGKSSDELQKDLDHLLSIWQNILQQSKMFPSPRLVHQEASVVTRAVRDYLRDDIVEIWVDNEYAYNEVAHFIESMMPQQLNKLRKYAEYEPMFSRFGIERQIETAYQREVRLPSGGSIVIDQTEALVSIDINSSKSTKGADVSETAFHTNLEAADEIARQLRLRDMGGLIVIDFIDMATEEHQKQVENRLKEATKSDRARIQFAEISRFGLLEMSRQRLRPSLEEATGFLCPRCHGTGMIRDLRSLALSIMRQIEQKALQERQGEIQADVPTDIAAFLLNEKRESLVYLEQESGTRITILPHAHMESPEFNIVYNAEGYAPPTYERITESLEQEYTNRGYDTSNWHTQEVENRTSRPTEGHSWSNASSKDSQKATEKPVGQPAKPANVAPQATPSQAPTAVAWLSNLFAPTEQAKLADSISSQDAAAAIESIVNTGARSLGVHGHINYPTATVSQPAPVAQKPVATPTVTSTPTATEQIVELALEQEKLDTVKRPVRKTKAKKGKRAEEIIEQKAEKTQKPAKTENLPKREPHSHRESRGEKQRQETLTLDNQANIVPVPTPITIELSEQKTVPTDIQLHVHRAEKTIVTEEAVHISLDNSKGGIVQPLVKTTETIANNITIAPIVTTQAETSAENTIDVTVTEPSVISETPVVEVEPIVAIENVTTPENGDSQNTEPTTSQNVAEPIVLDVTPTQGRAKNDPREVYKAFSEQQNPTPAPVILPKISGTVAEFVQQYLPNASLQIAEFGIVKTFIHAVNAYHAQFSQFDSPTAENPEQQQAFEQFFRNYGYKNLSQESLDDYHNLITPSNAFHTTAGKTDAKPAPVMERASNDPRGQIVAIEPCVEPTQNTKTATTYPIGSAGALILEKLGEEGQQLIQQGEFVKAYLKALSSATTSANTVETVPTAQNPQEVPTGTEQTEATTTDVVDSVDTFAQNIEQNIHDYIEQNEQNNTQLELSQALENLENALAQALSQTQENPKKTSPTSYKNMIESVAEQIKLPSMGGVVLNLASPKPAKARTKKPKVEKPATKAKTRTSKKVENAVIVKKAKTDADETANSEIGETPNE